MFMHLPGKERFGYAVLGALLLFGMGVVGARNMRPAAPIVFDGVDPRKAISQQSPIERPAAGTSDLIADVAGEVHQPGIVRLPPGARVFDAIKAAGGSLKDADLDALNLAEHVSDGQRIVVTRMQPVTTMDADVPVGLSGNLPLHPEVVREPARPSKRPQEHENLIIKAGREMVQEMYREEHPGAPPARVEPAARTADAPVRRPGAKTEPPRASVSLNSASLVQLQTLPGVGPLTAQKIIDYRKEHGGFRTVDELVAVKSIGPKRVEALRPYLRL